MNKILIKTVVPTNVLQIHDKTVKQRKSLIYCFIKKAKTHALSFYAILSDRLSCKICKFTSNYIDLVLFVDEFIYRRELFKSLI